MGNSVEVEADDDDHGEAIVAVVVVADPEDSVADNEEDVDDVVAAVVVVVVLALPCVRACWAGLVVLPFLLHSPRIVPESLEWAVAVAAWSENTESSPHLEPVETSGPPSPDFQLPLRPPHLETSGTPSLDFQLRPYHPEVVSVVTSVETSGPPSLDFLRSVRPPDPQDPQAGRDYVLQWLY